jgi:hypothetical protein
MSLEVERGVFQHVEPEPGRPLQGEELGRLALFTETAS